VNKELKHELEELAADLDRAAREAAIEPSLPSSLIAADEPIHSSTEDRLNRTGFAKELATAINRFNRVESIVVGIYGKWGTGKTSLLNLIEEQLQETSPQPPIIFRFNPWGFSEQEQLTYRFFGELSAFLRLHLTVPSLAEIADTVEEYGQSFSPIGELLLPRATKAVKAGWNLFRRLKPFRQRTVTELKAEIDSALRVAKAKFIVMIDDIDRLNTIEIRQVFQLVKLNANFSNTVFLVAFDNERIATALGPIAPEPATEYLEKIVQVAFNLPPIADSTLTQIILSNIDETIASLQIKDLDTQRFGNMFHSGFRQSFRTIRDVNRYFNLLRFALRLVGYDTNFIDLVGMQALSLFYPSVYSEIQSSSDLFIGTGDRETENKKKLETEYSAIFDRVSVREREHAYSLCAFLFPKMRSVGDHFGLTHESGFDQVWRKDKRVASSKYFPYYFQLAVPDTEVSQVDLDRALDTATSVPAFVKSLSQFKISGKLTSFIGILRDSLARADQHQLTVMLESVFVFGDEVDTRRFAGTLGIISDHVQFASWLLFDIIDLLQDDRFGKVVAAMRNGTAPFTIVNFVGLCVQMLLPNAPSEAHTKYPDLTAGMVDEMKVAALDAIHAAADDDRLANAPELPRVLLAWKRWEGEEGPKAWIERVFLTDGIRAADLLSRFLGPASSFGLEDKVPSVSWRLSFGVLREFADVDVLAKLLQGVANDKLSEFQRLAKDEFWTAKEKLDQGVDPDGLR
jgi:predicted KAP-like P-loop ATPase